MKNLIAVTFVAAMAVAAVAEDAKKQPVEMDEAETARREMISLTKRSRRHGGLLAEPNTKRGKVVFVNEQSVVPAADLKPIAEMIRLRDKINVEFVEGSGEKATPANAAQKKAALGAQVVVFISECDTCPNMMLTAPEGAWSIINAKVVCNDARNDAFKKTRMIKMTERGFYCAAGALNSMYPDSLMSAVRKPSDLDKLAMIPPMDVISRTIASMKDLGVTPQEYATYRQAVRDGWAPAPTNDIQKAIWEKFHALPTKPIKIKPETKKVTE